MNCTHCHKPAVTEVHQRTGGYCSSCAYLTIPEAITALAVSRSTYYRLVRVGKLHPRRIGYVAASTTLVPRVEIDAILEAVAV